MKYFLGVDIGGTKTAAGLLDADGHMLAEKEIPTLVHDGAERIVRTTAQLISSLAEQEGITEQLKAENQMKWVRQMNSVRNRAEKIIRSNLIYV